MSFQCSLDAEGHFLTLVAFFTELLLPIISWYKEDEQ